MPVTPHSIIDQRSWSTGEDPKEWRLTSVMLIYNKVWMEDPRNYRPVSLTWVSGKVIRQIVLRGITQHVCDNQGIRPSQNKFVKDRSCLTNLLSFCDLVAHLVDEGGAVDVGYLDFKLNVREPDVRVCDESSCKYGGVCKEGGDGLKCACQFQCHTNYIPVCGSNGDTYQNECFLRRAACKHQKEITVVSRGPCYSDNGSGSGEGEYEGSGTEVQRKRSKCGVCKYRAECDEDAENVGCVCNIDCSGYSFNPVCASDGSSYNNPCFVREASCLRQEQIDIRHLGHCSETDDTNAVGKKDDGMQYRPDVKDASDQREDIYIGNHVPCSENFNGYCIHGKCEFIYSTQKASCRCESGYTGQHCEKTDFSILYVVPSRQKLTHVLIAAIIGAVQIAIIVAIVMCITRKCPKNNRGRRQKQNLGHFTSDTSSRMV
ncbi:tomoregulin-1 [Nothoprocta perdicaria]|uniref:tomoregulin-1 n=1 Tax=Nothoprocta perdicaria TaxID=30464 RepID=UPI000E1B63E3|nr:tomoregulin-1 [Nothoprocta perdicaria]